MKKSAAVLSLLYVHAFKGPMRQADRSSEASGSKSGIQRGLLGQASISKDQVGRGYGLLGQPVCRRLPRRPASL